MITGEYAILDGAKALALPTKYGQTLVIEKLINKANSRLLWQSIDNQGKIWFQCEFNLPSLQIKCVNSETEKNHEIAKTLQFVLKEAKTLNPDFLAINESFHVKTALTFNRNWGLGTSSTLINNIANWAKVDAYKLQFSTFGGSAYDIACAQNNTAIIYQLQDNKPTVTPLHFNPKYKNQLYFIYLNKKKNSRIAIENYRNIKINKNILINEISTITNEILLTNSLIEFEKLLQEHENIIAKTINIKPIKKQLFKDYFGTIKSLGAWEGDFILATGNEDTPKYFAEKGYKTVVAFKDMIFNTKKF